MLVLSQNKFQLSIYNQPFFWHFKCRKLGPWHNIILFRTVTTTLQNLSIILIITQPYILLNLSYFPLNCFSIIQRGLCTKVLMHCLFTKTLLPGSTFLFLGFDSLSLHNTCWILYSKARYCSYHGQGFGSCATISFPNPSSSPPLTSS